MRLSTFLTSAFKDQKQIFLSEFKRRGLFFDDQPFDVKKNVAVRAYVLSVGDRPISLGRFLSSTHFQNGLAFWIQA